MKSIKKDAKSKPQAKKLKPNFIAKWKSFSKFGKQMTTIPVLPLKTPLVSGLAGSLKKKKRHEPSQLP